MVAGTSGEGLAEGEETDLVTAGAGEEGVAGGQEDVQDVTVEEVEGAEEVHAESAPEIGTLSVGGNAPVIESVSESLMSGPEVGGDVVVAGPGDTVVVPPASAGGESGGEPTAGEEINPDLEPIVGGPRLGPPTKPGFVARPMPARIVGPRVVGRAPVGGQGGQPRGNQGGGQGGRQLPGPRGPGGVVRRPFVPQVAAQRRPVEPPAAPVSQGAGEAESAGAPPERLMSDAGPAFEQGPPLEGVVDQGQNIAADGGHRSRPVEARGGARKQLPPSILPAPGTRISFGKGNVRRHFKPSNVRMPWPPRPPAMESGSAANRPVGTGEESVVNGGASAPVENVETQGIDAGTQVPEQRETRPVEPAARERRPLGANPTIVSPSSFDVKALPPTTAADSAALASFSEDIEIEDEPEAPQKKRVPTGREMLINVAEGEEVRIAVTQHGLLEELYMERSSTESHIGNIYKGRVTNVEPSIQAAFIDFGIGKNGFLHISDLHPQYFPQNRVRPAGRGAPRPAQRVAPQPVRRSDAVATQEASTAGVEAGGVEAGAAGDVPVPEQMDAVAEPVENPPVEGGDEPTITAKGSEPGLTDQGVTEGFGEGASDGEMPGEESDLLDDYEVDDAGVQSIEKVGRKIARRDRPNIQACLRRGQEVLVQVTKEGIGTKGPTLTTYISIPGRYLVMMPGMKQLGVSRKIDDDNQRRELRKILEELNPPKNLGFIVRTAGIEQSKKEIQGDLNYLVRMWKVIASRIRNQKNPSELYEESDLVIRTIRDVFNSSIDRIIVDNEAVASRIRDFLSIVNPRNASLVELYTGQLPLFQRHNIEKEIEKINSRRVEMPNGGSLVIDSAEALVAIDVNSGRYRETRDAEMSAFNVNREAVKEVCRQLRLRDLGGVVVIDFIDMREERNKREIERLLKEELKEDRAKTKVLRMSLFCMIEMTRQRVRPSLKRSIYQDCPHCRGSALIKTPESASLDVMRRLAAATMRADVQRVDVRTYPTIASYLLNKKRKQLVELEDRTGKKIAISPDEALAGDATVLEAYDGKGMLLALAI